MLNHYPFNSLWVRSWIGRWLAPIWFGCFAAGHMVSLWLLPPTFGFDIRLYQLAAQAWLAGGDPWSVGFYMDTQVGNVQYAGPPPTLVPFAAVAWVPHEYLVPVVVLCLAALALWVLHRLKLPTYWLLFPPILDAIWFGNMNIAVVALLVFGGSIAAAIATVLKVYAVVPILVAGRYRLAVTSLLAFIATLPFLPWAQFVAQFSTIGATLAAQSWGGQSSVLTSPLAFLGAVIALVLVGRARAAWLAVPLIWPATQFHYSVIGLPAFASMPALALAGAVPAAGVLGYCTMLLVLWERRRQIQELRLALLALPTSLRDHAREARVRSHD